MTERLTLRTDSGTALNATAEVSPEGIIFHSRSGTDRNRDYRAALELLLGRLDTARISYDIFLDSRPVQHLPLDQRRLAFDRQVTLTDRFDQLVRSMNAGSASHVAWRRLLISTPGTRPAEVAAALNSSSAAADGERLPAAQLRRVTSAHIHRAVARLLAGEDAPNFATSRDYFALTDDGVPLAPKKVFGLAPEEALGNRSLPRSLQRRLEPGLL